MPKKFDYRLRIADPQMQPQTYTYFTRTDGKTSYFSASETPLALSNLLQGDAAETRFALLDAESEVEAVAALQAVLAKRWHRNPKACPVVEAI